jgi:PAS domain S-box-containing protein
MVSLGLEGALREIGPHAVVICDAAGRPVLQNDTARELWAGAGIAAPVLAAVGRCLTSNAPVETGRVPLDRPDGTAAALVASVAPVRDAAGGAVGALCVLTDVTALEQDERRRIERLQRLRQTLSGASAPSHVAAASLGAAVEALGASFGALALLDDAAAEIRIDHFVGVEPGALAGIRRLPATTELPVGQAIRGRRVVTVASAEELLRRVPDAPSPPAPGARIVAPLLHDDRAVGALVLGFEGERFYSHGEREFLEAVASHCAQALDRARLFAAERRAREEAEARSGETGLLLALAEATGRATDLPSIYRPALDAVVVALGVERASILLYDEDGVMRFKAWRGLSDAYRRAVEGHSPWTRDQGDAQPIVVPDVLADPALAAYRDVFAAERIRALAFFPLAHQGRLLGKFMVYAAAPRELSPREIQLAGAIGVHVSLAVARAESFTRERAAREQAERHARRTARLLRLTSSLSLGLRAVEVGQAVIVEGAEAVEADTAAIWRLDATGTALELLGTHRYPDGAAARWGRMPLDPEIPVADAVLRGEPVWIDSRADYAARYPASEARTRPDRADSELAIACVPLLLGERRMGVVAFTFFRARALSEDDRTVLVAMAQQCAQSLERARLFEALRESEERFRAMADDTAIALWVNEASGAVQFVNRAYREFFGVTLEELQALGWRSLVHPDDQAAYAAAYERAATAREPFRAQARVRRADGTWRWIESYGRPRLLPSGELVGVAGSTADVTEQKEAERALQEADRRKDEFLAMLSHELRNPLAPIRTGLQLLQRSAPGSEQAQRTHQVIERQVTHLTRLVDDLLDVTRIARGKIQLQREKLELGELVRRTVEDHRAAFTASGVTLDASITTRPLWVRADATRVAQVIGNLLQNAVKFTPEGRRVEASLAELEGMAVLRVRDAGVGMAPELLGKIFEPFTQAEATLARSRGGLGLGLALVKGLVDLHGGQVEAASEGIDRGSTFTVRLPLEAPAPVDAEPLAAATLETRRRVLIIEDNIDGAETLRELLEIVGHEVEVAHCGVEGVRLARELRPDVIFCDIGLPEMDGYAVARELRADPSLSGTLLVALSGYALAEDVRRAADAGFDHHLAKPPELDRLQQLIARARP